MSVVRGAARSQVPTRLLDTDNACRRSADERLCVIRSLSESPPCGFRRTAVIIPARRVGTFWQADWDICAPTEVQPRREPRHCHDIAETRAPSDPDAVTRSISSSNLRSFRSSTEPLHGISRPVMAEANIVVRSVPWPFTRKACASCPAIHVVGEIATQHRPPVAASGLRKRNCSSRWTRPKTAFAALVAGAKPCAASSRRNRPLHRSAPSPIESCTALRLPEQVDNDDLPRLQAARPRGCDARA